MALTSIRSILCATGLVFVTVLRRLRSHRARSQAPAALVPARAALVALTFLYFRHCRKCLKDKSKQKQYRESVKKNAYSYRYFKQLRTQQSILINRSIHRDIAVSLSSD